MKHNIILLGSIILIAHAACAQVGIGNINPDPSAILDVTSNSKGFLPPRMTTQNRNDIINPVEGLLIYNSSKNCLEVLTGPSISDWFTLCPNTVPVASNLNIIGNLFPGSDITATYDYTDLELHNESGSTIKWFLADNISGTKTEIIAAQNNSTYTIQPSDLDKFIFFSVIPKDELGGEGEEVFSLGNEILNPDILCAPNVTSISVAAGNQYGRISIDCVNNKLFNRSWTQNNTGANYRYKTSASSNYVNISSWDTQYKNFKTITATEMANITEFSGNNSGNYGTTSCSNGPTHGTPITISGSGYIRVNPTTKVLECYYHYIGNFCDGAGGQYTDNVSSTTCQVVTN